MNSSFLDYPPVNLNQPRKFAFEGVCRQYLIMPMGGLGYSRAGCWRHGGQGMDTTTMDERGKGRFSANANGVIVPVHRLCPRPRGASAGMPCFSG